MHMRITDLLKSIVQQELIDNPNRQDDEALHFHLDISLTSYETGRRFGQSCGLHLLYHLPPRMSYVNVFVGVADKPFAKLKEVKLEHSITHDSEWRSISEINQIYFGMASVINSQRIDQGFKEEAPILMSENNYFVGRKVFERVKVKVETDPDCDMNYSKLITVL